MRAPGPATGTGEPPQPRRIIATRLRTTPSAPPPAPLGSAAGHIRHAEPSPP